MLKIFMSIFSAAVLLFGLALQASTEIPVQVLNATYNAQNDTVDVLVFHKNGGCGKQSYSLSTPRCTEMIVPYNCFVKLQGFTEQVCNQDTFEVIPFSISQMDKRHRGTLTITGAEKSHKSVNLR